MNIINNLESAFQAYDEGSIPFTRSNSFNGLVGFLSFLKLFRHSALYDFQ